MPERALTILLVEDDEVDVMTVRRAFKKANITNQMFVAQNGIEALQLLRTDGIPASRRLVLLDLNMPRVSGIEILDCIRGNHRTHDLNVIMMTTSNRSEDRQRCKRHGADDYVVKPHSYQELVDIMRDLVARTSPPDRSGN